MQTTGGLILGGIIITPPPPPTFFNFGGAYITNAPQNDNYFGDYIAINSDGTVFVAADGNLSKVYIYSRSGITWSLQQTLTGAGYFGASVSLSSDGLTLFVGNQAATKIYSRESTSNTFTSAFDTLRADLPRLSSDGTAFAYSNDGHTTLRLGKKTAGTWSELTAYTMSTTSGNMPLLAMNSDGSRIAYAKIYETVSGISNAGQVKILSWSRTSSAPTLIQTINDPQIQFNNNFGGNLDMSPDGNTLIISSYYDFNSNFNDQTGAVYVYTWNGSQYTLQQSFIGASGQNFGLSNALGGDVLILTKTATPYQFLVYTRAAGTWTLQQTGSLPTGFTRVRLDHASGGFGNRTCLSADGKHFIVAEPIGTSRFVYYYQGG